MSNSRAEHVCHVDHFEPLVARHDIANDDLFATHATLVDLHEGPCVFDVGRCDQSQRHPLRPVCGLACVSLSTANATLHCEIKCWKCRVYDRSLVSVRCTMRARKVSAMTPFQHDSRSARLSKSAPSCPAGSILCQILELTYGCATGRCGTCRVKCVAGCCGSAWVDAPLPSLVAWFTRSRVNRWQENTSARALTSPSRRKLWRSCFVILLPTLQSHP